VLTHMSIMLAVFVLASSPSPPTNVYISTISSYTSTTSMDEVV